MTTRTNPRMGQDPDVNAPGSTNGASPRDIPVPCGFCLKRFRPKQASQRFCGARCRLLFWAAGEIVKDLEAGKADGIREAIRDLGRRTP
jgi:hypothetical protein